MMISDKKNKLKKIAEKYNLRFIILHGSYAKGCPRKDSDVDVAILGYKEVEFNEFLKLYGKIEGALAPLPGELDLKTLRRADPLFRYEVTRGSKLLYGDLTDYENYKASVYRAYVDAKPLRELERILIKKYQKHLNKIYVK